ncbi:unnamed protein product [Ectocarpus sp. CCAP 1310/34]|nr:unnamed protein product [Ectocarpus sp. CCAP 1310/34]
MFRSIGGYVLEAWLLPDVCPDNRSCCLDHRHPRVSSRYVHLNPLQLLVKK